MSSSGYHGDSRGKALREGDEEVPKVKCLLIRIKVLLFQNRKM